MRRTSTERALLVTVALALAACTAPSEPTSQAVAPLCGPGGCCTLTGAVDSTLSPDSEYYLTSFGGGGFNADCSYDTQSVACGGREADGCWYYAADHQRWPCHTKLRLSRPDAPDRCVVVEVADTGPDECVETAAGRRIVDASPVVAYELFDTSCLGWSDAALIRADVVPGTTPDGPCAQHGECATASVASSSGSGTGAWSCSHDGTARTRCIDNQHIECQECPGGCASAMCVAPPADAGVDAGAGDSGVTGDGAVDASRESGVDASRDAVSDARANDGAAHGDSGDAHLDAVCDGGGECGPSVVHSGCGCRTTNGARGAFSTWLALLVALAIARPRRVRGDPPRAGGAPRASSRA